MVARDRIELPTRGFSGTFRTLILRKYAVFICIYHLPIDKENPMHVTFTTQQNNLK